MKLKEVLRSDPVVALGLTIAFLAAIALLWGGFELLRSNFGVIVAGRIYVGAFGFALLWAWFWFGASLYRCERQQAELWRQVYGPRKSSGEDAQ